MTPVEQDHIVGAYTFELGKCYEETIRRRQLQALANVDPDLCARVALGLGLEPQGPTEALAETPTSPALSQLGGRWPVDGRRVGIVIDPTGDLESLPAVRRALLAGGLQPVLVAATGGQLPDGTPVQRTFLTARSVEFDALLLAASPAAAPDAPAPALSKSGLDPRVEQLITECHRQAKALGAWSSGEAALTALVGKGPGVVTAANPLEVVEEVQRLLSGHRVWQRTMAAPG